ncbi:peptidylprolyl isomerase [bacterium]|nr:peptidylprolyl isomerase [bacterium]
MKKKFRIILAVAAVVQLSTLSGMAADQAPPPKETISAASRVVPAGPPVVFNQVQIRVGNEIVSTVDIEEPLAKYREHFSTQYRGRELEAKMTEARKLHIARMIEGKLLLLEARSQEIEIDDALIEERVDKEIEQLRAQFPSYREFKMQLEKDHLTEADLRKQRMQSTRENLIRQRLLQSKLQEFKTGIEVSDERLKGFYKENISEFSRPDRARISQIFIKRPGKGLASGDFQAQDQVAKRKIQRVLAALKQGDAFASAAQRYSEHKITAEKGGDIGWIEEGDIGFPVFEKTVFKRLKIDQVSGILQTPKGYFVVKLIDKQTGGQMPFEEVRGSIRKKMMAESSDVRYKAWLESLKGKYKVVYAAKEKS